MWDRIVRRKFSQGSFMSKDRLNNETGEYISIVQNKIIGKHRRVRIAFLNPEIEQEKSISNHDKTRAINQRSRTL